MKFKNNIYGKLNYLAFNKLCNRFKDLIYDVLLLDSSIQSSGYSRRNNLSFELRKKVIQADIIQLRGMNDDLMQIYNSVISKSYSFEFYDILIQALNSKLRFVSSFGKETLIENIKNEISLAEIKWLGLSRSQRIYQTILNTISRHSEFNYYKKDLDSAIIAIKEYYNKTKSSLVRYYLISLEIEQAQISNNYSSSNLLLLELERLVKTNESVYTDNRYGTILLNIANNFLLLREYNQSIVNAENSRKFFKGIYLTQKIVDETIFYAYFYQNNFDACEKYLSFDNSFNRNISTEILFSKFNFYQACIEFKKGNYLKCISLLEQYKEIEKDKEGWNISRRILIILSRIELGQFDSLDLSIGNMQKYLKRLSKTNYLNPRFLVIMKICLVIVRESVDWNRIKVKNKLLFKYLAILKSDNYSWQIKSPELINFEDWVRNKISA
ncbi:MAG: hypothetical protein IPL24_02410 [Bacteroidetes bacterium]|nr:hypothetical protein [Bacteroidota bacterium]